MNKYLVIFLVAVVAVVGVVYLRGAQVAVAPSPTPSVSMVPSTSPSVIPKPTAKTSVKPTPTPSPTPGIIFHESQIFRVNIQASAYSPVTVTAQRGDIVIFDNMDSIAHTVTADAGVFDSTTIDVNQSWTLPTANLAPGTYAFHCVLHPSMHGTLIVQ